MIINKIKNKNIAVGVIGLGYVGLPLVLRFNEMQFTVIGFDVDNSKLLKLQQGESYLNHISDITINKLDVFIGKLIQLTYSVFSTGI